MKDFANRRVGKMVLAAVVSTVMVAASGSRAAEVYADSVFTNGGPQLGATELFVFGPYGAPGSWGCTNLAVESTRMARMTSTEGTGNGCHGVAVHLAHPDDFKEHGPLEHGHVLRLSCWLAVDASAPINRQDWQFAVLKFEFYREALGDPHADPEARLFDSDLDTDGDLVTSYAEGLSPTEWRRFSLEYTVDTNQVNLAQLKEVRPVVVQGDFAGGEFTGNVLVADLRVDVFKDRAEADAKPQDAPPPAGLPAANQDG